MTLTTRMSLKRNIQFLLKGFQFYFTVIELLGYTYTDNSATHKETRWPGTEAELQEYDYYEHPPSPLPPSFLIFLDIQKESPLLPIH